MALHPTLPAVPVAPVTEDWRAADCRVEVLAMLSELESMADRMAHKIRMARKEYLALTGGLS